MNTTEFYSTIEDFTKRRFGNNLEPYFRGTVTTVTDAGVTITRTGETAPDAEVYPVLSSYTPYVGDDVLLARINGGKAVVIACIGRIPRIFLSYIPTQTISAAEDVWTDIPNTYFPGATTTFVPTKSGKLILNGKLSAWAVTNVPCFISSRFKLVNVTDNTTVFGAVSGYNYCHVANNDVQDHNIIDSFALTKGKAYRINLQLNQSAATQSIRVSKIAYEGSE